MAFTKTMQDALAARLEQLDEAELRGLVEDIWHELYPEGGAYDTGPSGADFIDVVGQHLDRLGLDPRKLDTDGWNNR